LRLDDNATPAALVEPTGYIVSHRMASAHIDIEPLALVAEDEGEVIILEMLGVGQVHGKLRAKVAPAQYTNRARLRHLWD
jgi:hypothetical protein